MFLLAQLLTELTGHPRQQVIAGKDFQWSGISWTHNLFRLYELICWRRAGIRFEAATTGYYDQTTRQTIEIHSFGTWESLLAYAEAALRSWVKGSLPTFHLVKVPVPAYSFAGGYGGIDARGAYVFAIAFDATAANKDNGGVTTTVSITHVTTGSNTLMSLNGATNSVTNGATVGHSGFTYNAIASIVDQTQSSGQHKVTVWHLIAPTTGSNPAIFTISAALTGGGQQISGIVMTYTGCLQSGQPDSSNKNASASSPNPFPVTTTVVASNCWLSGSALDENTFNSSTTPGSGTVYRSALQFNHFAADSNATVGTGSQSLNWGEGAGGSVVGGAAMSIAPVAAAATTVPRVRQLMGIGS